jgi:hypothetical protein
MSASSNWHYRSVVAGVKRRSVSGMSERPSGSSVCDTRSLPVADYGS